MEKIIDGVDVSKCKHITKAREVGDQHCALYDYNYCIGKMCEYKQLKRLEQENELMRQMIKKIIETDANEDIIQENEVKNE